MISWDQRVNGLVVPLGPEGDTSIPVVPGTLKCPITTPKSDSKMLRGEVHVLQALRDTLQLKRIATENDVEVIIHPDRWAVFGDAKTTPRPYFLARELSVYFVTFEVLKPIVFEAAVAFTMHNAPNVVLSAPRRLSGPMRAMGAKRRFRR